MGRAFTFLMRNPASRGSGEPTFRLRALTVLCAAQLGCTAASGAATQRTNNASPNAEETSPAFLTDAFSYRFGCYRPQISLDGAWQFRRDRENQGISLGFHEGREEFPQTINLPGVPQAQGLGVSNGYQKWFLNEPFWVRRTFTLPPVQSNQRVWLRLGGILPAGEVYLNGVGVGYTKSSRTQQRVDVTRLAKPASENLIAIKVCDWPQVKLEGLWEMAELQRVWTGVYRPVRLEITDEVSLLDAYLQPQLASGSVKVTLELAAAAPANLAAELAVQDGIEVIGSARIQFPNGATTAVGEVKMDRFTTWSPNHPRLYRLDISLRRLGQSKACDQVGIRFGMREIATRGAKFYLNGEPIYLRCFGDDQLYLDTLAPPTDLNWYLPRLQRAREYGFNAAKSCEEIFSQDFLEAADEAGIMIIQEMPFGLSGYVRTTQHKLEEPWRRFYAKEFAGLCQESRNHASVIAYSMCSEVPLDSGSREAFDFFVRELPSRSKELAPHALVIDNTGWLGRTKTALGDRRSDFYAVIIPTWMKEVLNETPIVTDGLHPNVLHEYNWWSCYPDPTSREKYKDTAILPWWLDALEASTKDKGQLDLVPTYVKHSLKLQAICRKDGLEYARRCPNVEGFILWLLIDFGQYTEGLLDDFWMPKNVTAKELLKSTGDTIVLLAVEGNRSLRQGEPAAIPLAISHYGESRLRDGKLRWRALGPSFAREGEIGEIVIPQGELTRAGTVRFVPPAADQGYKLEIRVALFDGDQLINENDWSFWAFPGVPKVSSSELVLMRLNSTNPPAIPAGTPMVVAGFVDQALVDYVSAGGKCLLLSRGAQIENTNKYAGSTTFYTTFRTIPWNAGPGNSGSVITPHPALATFPHEEMCDLQFVWAIQGVIPMNFEPLRAYGVEPIIRMIDFYRINAHNAHLLEFGVGRGQVLATSLNLQPDLDERLELQNLMASLVRYAQSETFTPVARVPPAEFFRLFTSRAEVQPLSAQPKEK